jgi:hypothetical protein
MSASNPGRTLHAFASESESRFGAPSATATPRGGGLLALHLSGLLPDDWSLRLTHGLASRSINVRSGYARRMESVRWQAQLEIDLRCGAEPEPDFLALATQGALTPAQRCFSRRRTSAPSTT